MQNYVDLCQSCGVLQLLSSFSSEPIYVKVYEHKIAKES